MTDSKPSFQPARRGDCVLLERETSYTTAKFKTVRTPVYSLAVITSIDREGRVKAAKRPMSCPWPYEFDRPGRSWVLPAEKIGGHGDVLLKALGHNVDFASLGAAQIAIRDALGKSADNGET